MHLLDPTKRWQCPSCDQQHVSHDPRPHTPMHPCRGQKGLSVPYVEVTGVELPKNAVRHVAIEREDYVAGELVQLDGDSRPVMAVRTERPDGSYDCTVFAPTASATVQ